MIIKYVSSKRLKNKYWGMNPAADKELHAHTHIGKNEILIDKNIHGRFRQRTIAHEKEEYYQMTKNHLPYKKADSIALKWDKRVK